MLGKNDVIAILKKEKAYIEQNYGVKRIGLFGSFARDMATEQSDVDLLLEFSKTPALRFVRLAEYLEEKLGRKADLLTPAGISSIRVAGVADSIRKELVYV